MAGKAKDHTGKRFGLWTVICRAASKKRGGATWLCLCDCGTEKIVPADALVKGRSKSCGCMSEVWRIAGTTKHGHTSADGRQSDTYRSWHAMRQRCENENGNQFADYGGRGISVCERWIDFRNFLADMGERPKGMTLDRIDPNGNYEPGNCAWATRKQQSANQRMKVRNSDVMPLLEAAAKVIIAANDNVEAAISELASALEAFKNRRAA